MQEFIYFQMHVNICTDNIYNEVLKNVFLAIRVTRDLRHKLYKAILNQESAYFDKRGTGELVSRLSADAQTVGNSLSQNISDGLRNSIMVLSG